MPCLYLGAKIKKRPQQSREAARRTESHLWCDSAPARGIAAEPPNERRPQVRREAQARRGSGGSEGDGADSPTRAGKAREAARPNSMC
jgi:hypothetical protein